LPIDRYLIVFFHFAVFIMVMKLGLIRIIPRLQFDRAIAQVTCRGKLLCASQVLESSLLQLISSILTHVLLFD